jgi:peptide/nickel transport system permease protein
MKLNILLFSCNKLIKLFVLLFAVITFSFIMVSNSPIDPVNAYVGADMMKISSQQKELIAKRWGLDKPAHERFFNWTGQIVRGNFGISAIYNEPVISVINKRFTTSLKLMAVAWILSGFIGFVAGVIAGVFESRPVDRIIRFYSYTMASTPAFWMGMVLLVIFSVSLKWTPVCSASPPGILPEDVTFWQQIHHLILPALTLSIVGIAPIALHTREKVIDVMQSDYVLFARAQGDTTFGIITFHTLRNVAIPAITLQFASIGELFGGSVLAEQVFSYPGLGMATTAAGIRGDVPLLLGIVIFSTIMVYSGNTVADILYRVIDPRIKIKES